MLSTALQQSPAGEGAGIWVKSNSPIKNPKELKGKTLGSYALRSTGYTQVRLALIQKYGLNAALEGGDVKQVEIQAPNLPGALAAGQIDAATLIHSQAFRALKSGEFRPIAETGRDNIEAFGMRFISALNVSYPERLAQRPDAFKEFNRMFRESVRYALAHRDEVFGAVGKKTNLPPEFFNWWFEKSSDVPGTFTEEHAKIIMKFYELSKEIGMIQSFPDIRTVVWEHALRSLMVEAGVAARSVVASARAGRPPARRASVHAAVPRRLGGGVVGRAVLSAAGPCSRPHRASGRLSPAHAISVISARRCSTSATAIAISFVIGSLLALIPYYRAGAAVRDRAPHRSVPECIFGHRLDAAVDHVVRRHAADRDLRDQRGAGAVRAGQHVGGPGRSRSRDHRNGRAASRAGSCGCSRW